MIVQRVSTSSSVLTLDATPRCLDPSLPCSRLHVHQAARDKIKDRTHERLGNSRKGWLHDLLFLADLCSGLLPSVSDAAPSDAASDFPPFRRPFILRVL